MGFLAAGCGMTLHHRLPHTSGFTQSALFQKITLWSVISTTKGRRDPIEAYEMAVACSAFSFDFIYRISPYGIPCPWLRNDAPSSLFHHFGVCSIRTISENYVMERHLDDQREERSQRSSRNGSCVFGVFLRFHISPIPYGIPCRWLRNDAQSSPAPHFGIYSIRTISENYVMERHLDDQREERSQRSLRNSFDKTTPI